MTAWSPEIDEAIRSGRAAGLSWERLANSLHIAPNRMRVYAQTVLGLSNHRDGCPFGPLTDPAKIRNRERWRKRRIAQAAVRAAGRDDIDDIDDPNGWLFQSALPPGHPVTWGAISAIPYPGFIGNHAEHGADARL